jgi:hypothetical protein
MRLYQALLHLYPSSFRAEYGHEMLAGFAKRYRSAGGAAARFGLLASAAGDTLLNAALVQATCSVRTFATQSVRSSRLAASR